MVTTLQLGRGDYPAVTPAAKGRLLLELTEARGER